MNYQKIEQRSAEWWDMKVGKISGTRFGQLISTKDNILPFEVVSEVLDGYITPDMYINEDMQFGIDNEEKAIELYEIESGLNFERGGVILSDFSPIHMASPDAVNIENGIVVEAKCTMHGKTHLKRFFDGIDDKYIPQIVNYFAVSDDVKEVHFVSYCPFRKERPIIAQIVKRDTIIKEKTSRTPEQTVSDLVAIGLAKLPTFENEIKEIKEQFLTINNF